MPYSLRLDSSAITVFLECPLKYFYQYQACLFPRDFKNKFYDVGSAFHKMLATYYRNRHKLYIDILPEVFNTDLSEFGLENEEIQLLKDRMLQYVLYYQNERLQVLKNDQGEPLVEVGFSYPLLDDGQYLFVLEGRLDILAEFDKTRVVVDHKTQFRKRPLYEKSIQFRNYALVADVDHLLINYIYLGKSNKAEEMFERQIVYFPPYERRAWKEKLIKIFHQVLKCFQENNFPENYASCEGKFGYRCLYTPICEQPTNSMKNFKIEQMYEEREEWLPW